MKRGQFGPEVQGNKVHGSSSIGGSLCVYGPILRSFPVIGGRRSGYTLVEILVATTLTLILMTAVVTVFGGVGDGIAKSRRAMEQFDRLRTAAQQLRLDLQGVTVTLDGRPARPEESQGYFEYIEGGILSIPQASGNPGTPQAINAVTNEPDLTVGERGDILMFTTRNAARPFLGRYALNVDPITPRCNPTWPRWPGSSAARPCTAASCWWRRAWPRIRISPILPATHVFCQQRYLGPPGGGKMAKNLVPNSLGDLTKRENRFAHPVDHISLRRPRAGDFWGFPRWPNARRRLG